jgi:hypothetical protein
MEAPQGCGQGYAWLGSARFRDPAARHTAPSGLVPIPSSTSIAACALEHRGGRSRAGSHFPYVGVSKSPEALDDPWE